MVRNKMGESINLPYQAQLESLIEIFQGKVTPLTNKQGNVAHRRSDALSVAHLTLPIRPATLDHLYTCCVHCMFPRQTSPTTTTTKAIIALRQREVTRPHSRWPTSFLVQT